MTSSSEPQVLEALRFLTCHVTNSTQFNNCFKRFFQGFSLRNVIRKINIFKVDVASMVEHANE